TPAKSNLQVDRRFPSESLKSPCSIRYKSLDIGWPQPFRIRPLPDWNLFLGKPHHESSQVADADPLSRPDIQHYKFSAVDTASTQYGIRDIVDVAIVTNGFKGIQFDRIGRTNHLHNGPDQAFR